MLVGPLKGFTLLINGYDIFYICYIKYKISNIYFEQAKINHVFFFSFKIFLDMKNASVSLYFEWTKEKTDRKCILLPQRRASCKV